MTTTPNPVRPSARNGAHALVEQLHSEGVRDVFGIPGAQIMGLMDALYDFPDMRFITNRHEQGSGYMADGYARVTGKPGVFTTVPGVGVYNAGAALATAYASCSPILLLAGQINREKIGKRIGVLHEVHDQLEIVKPVTKWASRILDSDHLTGAVSEAFRQMGSGHPQPTCIEFPPEALSDLTESPILDRLQPELGDIDRAAVVKAAELLRRASRPMIIAGGGVTISDGHAELAQLAEVAQAVVMVTREGKAAIDNRHPLFVGSVWANTKRIKPFVDEADLIVAIGTRFEGIGAGPDKQVIRIDIDPFRLSGRQDIAIEGDARQVLLMLVDELEAVGSPPNSRSDEAGQMRATLEGILQEFPSATIIDSMRSAIPDDAIFIGGTSSVSGMCHAYMPIHSPRGYLSTSYMGTLGFSFCMGLGAKVGAPDRPVITASGDGGFLFASSELATAVQYGINTVNIVFNDNAYGNPNREQKDDWGNRVIGTELRNPDFVAYAQSFGADGMIAKDPDSLAGAIKDALTNNRPTVIEYPHERLPYLFRDLPPKTVEPQT